MPIWSISPPRLGSSMAKGRPPAGLNFADCLSYALAKRSGEPLLFKGDDFAKTDLRGVFP